MADGAKGCVNAYDIVSFKNIQIGSFFERVIEEIIRHRYYWAPVHNGAVLYAGVSD